ncbi:MAG TPA: phage major capsid protein [Longimicrobiaceae bacterium]|nr:phage major capsid protein [Longimicrobiaceae bacterium]
MAGADTTTVGNILQQQYLPGITTQFNGSAPNLRYVRQNSKTLNAEGTEAEIAVEIGYNESTGFHGESADVPDSGYPTIKKVKVSTKQMSARARITYLLMRRARTQAASFARGAQLQMTSTRNGFTLTANGYLWGDGTGVMCRVKSQTLTASRKMKFDRAFGLSDGGAPEYTIRVGQTIQLLDTKGYTDGVSTVRGKGVIEAVDRNTGTAGEIEVTIKAGHTLDAANTAAGDYVYLQNTIKGLTDSGETQDNRPWMGFLGFYDDAQAGTLQSITTADDPWWKPNKVAVAEATVIKDMRRAFNLAEKRGGQGQKEGMIAYLISSYETQERFVAALDAKVEFRNVKTVDGYWTSLVYNGKPWFKDHTAPDARVFFKPAGNVMERHASDDFINFVNDGRDVLHQVPNKTVFDAILTCIAEYGIRRRENLVSTTGMNW